jgi:hypothetical protein
MNFKNIFSYFILINNWVSESLEWNLKLSPNHYSLTINFIHQQDTLPIPNNPNDCNPTDIKIANDGIPFLAPRHNLHFWKDTTHGDIIYNSIGLYSLSYDWMPCGHPPVNVFTTPHYDIHFYYISEIDRDKINCPESPPAPVCSKESSPEFYINMFNNLPNHFEMDINSAVPRSGIHWHDITKEPISTLDWTNPFTIIGSYNGLISFWETMVPLNFKSNNKNSKYKENISYINKTKSTLPFSYLVEWNNTNNTNNIITIQLNGITNFTNDFSCTQCQLQLGKWTNNQCLLEYTQNGKISNIFNGCNDKNNITYTKNYKTLGIILALIFLIIIISSCFIINSPIQKNMDVLI